MSKFGSDELLPGELQVDWLRLLEVLADDSFFKILRYYLGKSPFLDFAMLVILR